MNCADDLTSVDLTLNPHTTTSTSAASSSQSSLFPFISHAHSYGLNLARPTLPRVLRALDTKDVVMSNEEVDSTLPEGVDSVEGEDGAGWKGGDVSSQEGDDEMILHIQFTSLIRLTSLLLGTSGGHLPTSPRTCKLYVNKPDGISFDDVHNENFKPDGEFELLEEMGQRGATGYPVRVSRFGNVRDLDVYLGNARTDQSTLYYLGFLGSSRTLPKLADGGMTVGAENGVSGMLDGVRETKGSGSLVK